MSSFQSLNEDGGVPLANSVSVSDKLRVDFLKAKARQRGSTDQCPFRHGKDRLKRKIQDQILKSKNGFWVSLLKQIDPATRIRVHQRNQRILSQTQNGFSVALTHHDLVTGQVIANRGEWLWNPTKFFVLGFCSLFDLDRAKDSIAVYSVLRI